MTKKHKATQTLVWEELAKLTLGEWDDKGMSLNNVTNMEIKSSIHIIAYKIYSSSYENNVPCKVVDQAYKVVKKNLSFELSKLHHI